MSEGASLRAHHSANSLTGAGQPRTIKTTIDGAFAFDGVAAGAYALTVRAEGFPPAVQQVRVGDAMAPPLTIALALEDMREDVSVRGTILGTAATGKASLPLRDLPMTSIPSPRISSPNRARTIW